MSLDRHVENSAHQSNHYHPTRWCHRQVNGASCPDTTCCVFWTAAPPVDLHIFVPCPIALSSNMQHTTYIDYIYRLHASPLLRYPKHIVSFFCSSPTSSPLAFSVLRPVWSKRSIPPHPAPAKCLGFLSVIEFSALLQLAGFHTAVFCSLTCPLFPIGLQVCVGRLIFSYCFFFFFLVRQYIWGPQRSLNIIDIYHSACSNTTFCARTSTHRNGKAGKTQSSNYIHNQVNMEKVRPAVPTSTNSNFGGKKSNASFCCRTAAATEGVQTHPSK